MQKGIQPFLILACVTAMLATGCDKLSGLGKSEGKSATVASKTATAPLLDMPSLAVAEHDRVAVVNEKPLSVKDVDLNLTELKQLAQAYGQEWKPIPVESEPATLGLDDVLDNLVVLELKAQDAKARGEIFRKTDVQRRWAYLERTFYAKQWDELQESLNKPSQEEINAFYEANKTSLIEPERIHLRQIVTATLAEAEAARARAVQGELFQRIAGEVSIGPGKELGGDIGEFVRANQQNLVDESLAGKVNVLYGQLESVAFTLENDQISQPVKDPNGRFVVVQLVGRTSPKQKTLTDVEDGITRLLTIQKIESKVEELRKKASVTTFLERLGAVAQ